MLHVLPWQRRYQVSSSTDCVTRFRLVLGCSSTSLVSCLGSRSSCLRRIISCGDAFQGATKHVGQAVANTGCMRTDDSPVVQTMHQLADWQASLLTG